MVGVFMVIKKFEKSTIDVMRVLICVLFFNGTKIFLRDCGFAFEFINLPILIFHLSSSTSFERYRKQRR